MPHQPKVSVIIPTYNRKEFLKQTVTSVLTQTADDFELIVVDDGSTDASRILVESLAQDKRCKDIRYIYQKHQGVSAARNRGIKEARGKYVAFLDSDDRWVREKLQVQLKAQEENPEYLISHTDELWYRRGKLLNPKRKHKKSSGGIFVQSLQLCAVSASCVMVKKELFSQIGLFDESMPVCEDYDFWLRVTSVYPVLLVSQALTLKDGGRADQLSQQFLGQMDKYRIYSIGKLLDSGRLSPDKYRLAFDELERKSQIYGNGCLKRGKVKEAQFFLNLAQRYANK